MWANESFANMLEWLALYNKNIATQAAERVSIFGLDVYSLYSSIEYVVHKLEKINPAEAQKAQDRYACFDTYTDPQHYGSLASLFPNKSCRQQSINQLIAIQKKDHLFNTELLSAAYKKLYIEQNALVIKNAEHYYTALFENDPAASWNIRDQHMMQTIQAIKTFNKQHAISDKIIIWAHNSHIGNARATQMSEYGEINLGQLAKELFGKKAFSVGFTTFTGTVSAASSWAGNVKCQFIQPALPTSIEYFFHESTVKNFILILKEHEYMFQLLKYQYLQRAIGVIYAPQNERQSHYFCARLSEQFDAVIHYDITQAVVPLDKKTSWQHEPNNSKTFPSGL